MRLTRMEVGGCTPQTTGWINPQADTIPNVKLRTQENEPVSLHKQVSDKPTVLIFYRGGW